MSYENEIKFVASGYRQLEEELTPFGWCDIEQGYLNPNNRVRRMTFSDGTRQYVFTFKQSLPNGQNLEIELPIDEDQYNAAWDHTNERVMKRRITIEGSHLKWDIDFYRWQHGKYFVLAEVEMPTDMERPKIILPNLQPHLVYEVPRGDDRFAARRLADEAHVRAMATELGLLHDSV